MTPSPTPQSILDESSNFDKYYKAAQNDRDRLLAQVAMGIDDMRATIKILKDNCPELNGEEEQSVKVIEAKSKMYMALSEHWGKITVMIVGCILSFLAGHFIMPTL
jgi:hypothetical protein